MRRRSTAQIIAGIGFISAFAGVITPRAVQAQGNAERQLPPITLDLRDAPIRQALEQVFGSAKVDYTIDNNVQGFVTLKITDQPFENALRLIMRSASVPLTYTRESGVYIVRPRALDTAVGSGIGGPGGGLNDPGSTGLGGDTASTRAASYETIQLTYADPADLAGILNITILPVGVRQDSNQGGGGGGGFGGGGGRPGGPGGFNPANMPDPKEYNPLNPASFPKSPMSDRQKQRLNEFMRTLQARAKA